MKKLASSILGFALLSGIALAQPMVPKEEAPVQGKFESVKTHILYKIDKRISFLQKHKLCVEKAQNWKELSSCRPHRRIWHHPIRKMEPR